MKEILGYFVSENGAFWTVFDDNTTNFALDIQISKDGRTVEVLGVYDGEPGPDTARLIEEEYPLWHSILELSAYVEAEVGGASLDELRRDLIHQLQIPDELDWSYLLETAARGLVQANREARNMQFGSETKIGYHNSPNDFGSHYLPLLPPTIPVVNHSVYEHQRKALDSVGGKPTAFTLPSGAGKAGFKK